MDAPFVKLVEHHRAEIGEERILLESCGQDAFRGEQNVRAGAELTLEPDVPTDFAPERPAAFRRNPARYRTRRDAARLKDDDRAVGSQGGRHSRRLPCAWRSGEDEGAPLAYARDDLRQEGIDRKRRHSRSAAGWAALT
jgi:hypothetical protein